MLNSSKPTPFVTEQNRTEKKMLSNNQDVGQHRLANIANHDCLLFYFFFGFFFIFCTFHRNNIEEKFSPLSKTQQDLVIVCVCYSVYGNVGKGPFFSSIENIIIIIIIRTQILPRVTF